MNGPVKVRCRLEHDSVVDLEYSGPRFQVTELVEFNSAREVVQSKLRYLKSIFFYCKASIDEECVAANTGHFIFGGIRLQISCRVCQNNW